LLQLIIHYQIKILLHKYINKMELLFSLILLINVIYVLAGIVYKTNVDNSNVSSIFEKNIVIMKKQI